MTMKKVIKQEFQESISTKEKLLEVADDALMIMAETITAAYLKGNKLLIFGNGGSAADAQHIAGEMVGRFLKKRRALPCIALTTDTSVMTAVANDYDYSYIFARQIEGLATNGDVVLAISTSGNSPNVLEGLKEARKIGCSTIAFGGKDGGKMIPLADHAVVVPSQSSQRIQEGHILMAHILCLLVEDMYLLRTETR